MADGHVRIPLDLGRGRARARRHRGDRPTAGRSRPSRSASSTPSSLRSTSGRCWSAPARVFPRVAIVASHEVHAGVPRVRAAQHHRGERLPRARAWAPTCARSARGSRRSASARRPTSTSRTAGRCRSRRRCGCPCARRCPGPARAWPGAAWIAAPGGLRRDRHLRHGRHEHRRRVRARRAPRARVRARDRRRDAARADARHPHRRRGRRVHRVARLGRRAQGRPAERGRRSRARRATGAAAARRRSPTRTSCWAGSARRGSPAARSRSTPARAEAAIDAARARARPVRARDRARHRPRRQRQHGQRRARRHRAARRRPDRADARAVRRRGAAARRRARARAGHSARSRCRRRPGLLCALGLLVEDLRTDAVRTHLAPLERRRPRPRSPRGSRRWSATPLRWLDRERVPPARRRLERWLDLRYVGQNFELLVPVPEETWGDGDCAALHRRFFEAHEQVYGFAAEDEPVQVVNVRLVARGLADPPRLARLPRGGAERERRRDRLAAASTSTTRRASSPCAGVRPRAAPRRAAHRRSRGDRAVRRDHLAPARPGGDGRRPGLPRHRGSDGSRAWIA